MQDHYSASTNKTNPTFVLHKVRDSPEKFWSGQMDKLLVFKMSEVVKVLFSTQLLLTGPEVEKTHTYSEVRGGGNWMQQPLYGSCMCLHVGQDSKTCSNLILG